MKTVGNVVLLWKFFSEDVFLQNRRDVCERQGRPV